MALIENKGGAASPANRVIYDLSIRMNNSILNLGNVLKCAACFS
jgi:hypothetical protein